MKRCFTLTSFLFLAAQLVWAQLPPNQPEQDCFGAIPLCQNVYFQANSYQGRGENPDEINGTISCMILGERNSVWYVFKVQTPGNLCFTITPVDSTDDYDWAVYNITNASCAQIGINPNLEVACNFTFNTGCAGETGPNGRTDCAGQFEPCMQVQTGQTFVLNVSNFNASNAGYTIDFSQSDATLFDDVAPEIVSMSSFCTGVEVTFSENVLCATVDPGDFTFAGPDGPYTISQVTSESCDNGGSFDKVYRLVVDPPIQQAGTYTVALTGAVSDFCGNVSRSASQPIFMPLPPTAAMATLAPQCQGDNLFTFNYTGPSTVAAYAWSFGDGGSSILRQPQHTYSGYGDLTATLIIRDNNGCEDTTTQTIVVHPAPVARAQAIAPLCEDDSLLFVSLSQYPDATMQTFTWLIGDGTVTSQPVFEHVLKEPGRYPVMIRTTNNFGCEDTASMMVRVWPKADVDFVTEDNVCLGEPATLQFA
ncbi:MAG: PKD domain-containing protein, partial [Bacteroidia bacterium]|nr:PKD domain-containing protein [Bacteroidia bacterium]